MQHQAEIDDVGLSPSFNCYFPDSLTAIAAAKVSREFHQEQTAQFHEYTDADEDDFEFSPELSEAQFSHRQIDLEHRHFDFPVLNSKLLSKDELDSTVEEIDDPSSIQIKLHKFCIDEQDESLSSSSSDSDEIEGKRSGFFCMWSPVSSPSRKCKKISGATGSRSHGSRRWRIHNFLRRNSSDGEELSTFFLPSNKIDDTKQNRNVNSGEVSKVAGESSMASSPSFHELLYVQKRAQEKRDKTKSFLPYRQDLLGFFVNTNRIGYKKSSF